MNESVPVRKDFLAVLLLVIGEESDYKQSILHYMVIFILNAGNTKEGTPRINKDVMTVNQTEENWKTNPIVIFAGVLLLYTVSHSILALFHL